MFRNGTALINIILIFEPLRNCFYEYCRWNVPTVVESSYRNTLLLYTYSFKSCLSSPFSV